MKQPGSTQNKSQLPFLVGARGNRSRDRFGILAFGSHLYCRLIFDMTASWQRFRFCNFELAVAAKYVQGCST